MSILNTLKRFFQENTQNQEISTKSNENTQTQSQPKFTYTQSSPTDKRESCCPSCRGTLNKVPSRKTKCPTCEEFVFVRTRPRDKARVTVTSQEAKQIDSEWRVASGFRESHLIDEDEYTQEEKTLLKRFKGEQPSHKDIEWSLLNKKIKEAISNDDWKFYRSIKLRMGEILRSELRLNEALSHYFEMCYIDLNSPLNCGPNRVSTEDLGLDYPRFSPEQGGLFYTSVIQRVFQMSDFTVEEGKTTFISITEYLHKTASTPLPPQEAWSYLTEEIT